LRAKATLTTSKVAELPKMVKAVTRRPETLKIFMS
jgi:hypothetical protein